MNSGDTAAYDSLATYRRLLGYAAPYWRPFLLSVVSMVLIFVIGIQPPNDWALDITVGFLIITAVVWVIFENRRFQGPPTGELAAERLANIKAAEAAVGETTKI